MHGARRVDRRTARHAFGVAAPVQRVGAFGNRQKWIETLRHQLAEVISLIVAALIIKNRLKNQWDEGRGAFGSNPALLEKLQRLVLAQSKIRLLMNPTEPDHQRLHQAIDTALRRLKSAEALESETEADARR